MEFTVQNIYGLLLRSKLLSIDEARNLFARWNAEAKEHSGDVTRFLRWMVTHNYVTPYQAQLLGQGHAEGFFLNQYKILDRLGKGRMAGVYKAVHELGQVVAIKVLPPSRARDPNMQARFQREARLACKLRHPNTVRAFQVAEANGLHYFVMEYLEGETLGEVLERRNKLQPAEAVRLVHLALLGLQHIHEQGLVHRDLKPSNLILVPPPPRGPNETTLKCNLKILDIGLGRELFEETGDSLIQNIKDAGLTSEGVLLGTPDYMAPEQARDARHIDIRADIYALGCVLYHCLSGQPPFPDTNIISQMIRHATETPRPLKEFNPAVPDGLQQIVNWMMSKDPNQRYSTPGKAAAALQVFLTAATEAAPVPEADPRMKNYLSWLEIESDKPTPRPQPQPQPMPTVPSVNLPVATPAQTSTAAEKAKRRGKKKKSRANLALPGQPKPPAAARPDKAARIAAKAARSAAKIQMFDVELVPVPGGLQGLPGAGYRLTQRDLIMLGIGGGLVPVAIFFGFWLANISGLELGGRDLVVYMIGVATVLLLLPFGYLLAPHFQKLPTRLRSWWKRKPSPPTPTAVPAKPAAPVAATPAKPAAPAAIPVQPPRPSPTAEKKP